MTADTDKIHAACGLQLGYRPVFHQLIRSYEKCDQHYKKYSQLICPFNSTACCHFDSRLTEDLWFDSDRTSLAECGVIVICADISAEAPAALALFTVCLSDLEYGLGAGLYDLDA